jgi:tetratricopeptide (TPR) repeat protein
VITLVIGCGLAGAAFYYFAQPPAVYQIPSPSVALNVEKSPPKESPIVAVESAREPRAATGLPVEPVVATGANDVVSMTGGIELPAERLTVDDAGPAAGQPMGAEPRPRPQAPASVADNISEPSQAGAANPGLSAAAESQVGVRPGEVRIARSGPAGDVSATMNQAYAAYVAGNFAQAGELYQQVLSQRPEQRDALLGVAALKLREGQVAAAHRIYRQVLKRHPDNPTASAALFSIEGGAGDQVTEARLKMLLDQGVDVGYIYFSLGNLYARSKRWGDAQQAYFEALRNNPANPDYNYNLAVSLDRIGQRTEAVKFYAAAVDSTDAAAAGFDTASALARIDAISSGPSR